MHTLEQLRAGELAGIQRLQLACGLTEFPREIFDLAETLEILDLSGNKLSTLPDDLPRLARLRIIFCSDNKFTELPEVLGACAELSMVGFKANRIRKVSGHALPARLRWLVLTDNEIEELPEDIGRCGQLQKLMLAGNRLRSLPPSLSACSRLELLRIAANQLTELPGWLLDMPRPDVAGLCRQSLQHRAPTRPGDGGDYHRHQLAAIAATAQAGRRRLRRDSSGDAAPWRP
jgi:Leucine-rich repeat (LRR) protein